MRRRWRVLGVGVALLVAAQGVLGQAPAARAVDDGGRGPWPYEISVSPDALTSSGGPVAVSMEMESVQGPLMHGPDVWFQQGDATTAPVAASLQSGDLVDGTWVAQVVVPAGTGTWSLVIADAVDSGGDAPAPRVYPVQLWMGYPAAPAAPSGGGAPAGPQLHLSWAAPADGGSPIEAYRVVDPYGRTVATTSGAVRQAVVDEEDVPAGESPVYTVAAENAVGWSDPSPSSPLTPVPATAPQAPSGLSGTFGYGSAYLTWNASPGADMSAVTGYDLTLEPGGESCHTRARSCSFDGLDQHTVYTAEVRASNDDGVSPPNRLELNAAPAVTGVTGTVHGTSVVLAWDTDPNTFNHDSYTVTADAAGVGCVTTDTSCTISHLTGGRTYAFSVQATNRYGTGPASSTVTATPNDVPAAPAARPFDTTTGVVTAQWSTPDNGGLPIIGYTLTATPDSGRTISETVAAPATSVALPVQRGLAYDYTVTAQNTDGSSATTDLGRATLPTLFAVTGAAAVVGSMRIGTSLEATLPTWTPRPSTVTYQWNRDEMPIPGARSPRYTLTAADSEASISVTVAASADDRQTSPVTSSGRTAGAAPPAPFTHTRPPLIRGTPLPAHVLHAVTPAWTPRTTSLHYQWHRDHRRLHAATTDAYRLTTSDRHHLITVAVTGTSPGRRDTTIRSAAIRVH